MYISYARVSTQDLNLSLQLDALHAAGCAKVFVEQASGVQHDRLQPQAARRYAGSSTGWRDSFGSHRRCSIATCQADRVRAARAGLTRGVTAR